MRVFLTLLLVSISVLAHSQLIDSLNTAKNCNYMKMEEKEMIYEINRVRSDQGSYLQYVEPLLDMEKKKLKTNGKGAVNYSVTYTTKNINGKETMTVDTTWHYLQEEEVKALVSLVSDLKKMKKLSVLQPDSGIYNAAQKHTADNNKYQWRLIHTGSDGSQPWDRITRFSPAMSSGNENIAGRYPNVSAREIVLQLLIDSGIPGYGHRYNLLDPQWTHVACVAGGLREEMFRWVQNFGRRSR
jgi:uncharacterized protein YkwD